MASVNELINLLQYQSGDFGREGLNKPPAPYKSPMQKQAESISFQSLVADLVKKQQEAAILEKQRKLWDSVGLAKNGDKTTKGIATQVVDKEEAGGRDIVPVGEYGNSDDTSEDIATFGSSNGGYEASLSKSGKMSLRPVKSKSYDKVKVFDRAKKLAEQDLIMSGSSVRQIKASEFSEKLKQFIPQAEIDIYGEATTQPEESKTPKKPLNPTGETSAPEDFLPQEKNALKEKRGMIEVARDFYFGKKDKPAVSSSKVMIQTPDGKRGYIPQANLQKAIQRGAKLVQ